jgi:thiol:disulfide interchange protein DsbD
VRFLSQFLLAIALWFAASAAHADDGHSAHIKARLIARSPSLAPGGDDYVALDYTPAPGWHTYWKNPGDTGLAPKFTWDLPDGVTAADPQFQPPVLLPTLGLMSYGYDGRNVVLVKLHNGSRFVAGDALPLHARVDFLVCADICIPESLTVDLKLKVGAPVDGPDAATVQKAIDGLPRPGPAGTVDIAGGQVEFGFPLTDADAKGAYFFPDQAGIVSYPAPQTVDAGAAGFTIRTKAAGLSLPDGNLSGVLKLADGEAYQIALVRAPLAASVHGLGAPGAARGGGHLGLWLAIAGAFAGGLILNLMPCVFPILAMKLLALTRAGHDASPARRDSLVYGAGAVLSFAVLAVVLDVARALGQSLGWGFQLQSPYVTAALAVVLLLVALGMAGTFEFGAWLQRLGGNVRVSGDRPMLSAFMTGVLAVIVAAPCTAPFMGPAIGFALVQGGMASIAVFLALGLGFALPFVALTWLITLVPAIAHRLPKPGTWMVTLQRVLSLVMFGAVVWLVWVYAQQVSPAGLVLLLTGLVMIAAAVTGRLKAVRYLPAALLVLGVVVIAAGAAQPRPPAAEAGRVGSVPFDLARLSELRSQGRPVLVDLTAAWCVTCKVNEFGALADPGVARAFRDTATTYMIGDWTRQDARISHYLSLYGRSGVPLYVYYGAHGAEPKVLPQLLRADEVIKMLRDGAKGN